MSTSNRYPGYERTSGETFDFPYHGGGRKSVRQKIPFGDGEIHVSLNFSETWEEPSVRLDVAYDGNGPNTHFRFNPGRRDYCETILDGHGGH